MKAKANRVGLVLREDFGERLVDLLARMPVWVVDTPGNRDVARKIWASNRGQSHLTGLTTFKMASKSSAAERCVRELSTIDLHHGEYSANPHYSELEVFGLALSERVRLEFIEAAFKRFEITRDGFVAFREERV